VEPIKESSGADEAFLPFFAAKTAQQQQRTPSNKFNVERYANVIVNTCAVLLPLSKLNIFLFQVLAENSDLAVKKLYIF
jgi:hypothetical protein